LRILAGKWQGARQANASRRRCDCGGATTRPAAPEWGHRGPCHAITYGKRFQIVRFRICNHRTRGVACEGAVSDLPVMRPGRIGGARRELNVGPEKPPGQQTGEPFKPLAAMCLQRFCRSGSVELVVSAYLLAGVGTVDGGFIEPLGESVENYWHSFPGLNKLKVTGYPPRF
jgi:hypothetical protein